MKERARTIVLGLLAGWFGLLGTGKVTKHMMEKTNNGTKGTAARPSGRKLLQQEWDLRETRNDRVDFFIDFLSGQRHDDMQLWLERTGRYAPMIMDELDARGMPRDLIYLAIIESGLDESAYSHAHAAGIWQFISETGQRYGLEVSPYVDERRDPIKATDAALDYLSDLHDDFGSWYLAAAAYNTGEGRVQRILDQKAGGERGDDELYWAISEFIPSETRDYVPLMLAAGYIGKDPGQYGFRDLQFQDPLDFDEVRVPAGTPLELVARSANLDTAEVEALNPHLIRGTTPPDRDWDVRVPSGQGETVLANLEGAAKPAD